MTEFVRRSVRLLLSCRRFAEFAGASRFAHKSACVSTGTVHGGAGGLPLPFRAPGICGRRGPFEAHAATRFVGGRLSRKRGHIVARPDTQRLRTDGDPRLVFTSLSQQGSRTFAPGTRIRGSCRKET